MPPQPSAIQLLQLSIAWLVYFALHSLLASLALKHWVARYRPRWLPAYRLCFNALALLLLLPPLALTLWFRGSLLWSWSGVGWGLSLIITGLALVGFAWSLRHYDGREFIGLRQWREQERRVEDQERLRISPLHRFVRHPWYFLGLLLIWTRDMDPAFLTSAIAMTLYFIVGSRLEERKLLRYHGAAYAQYRTQVPGLIPLPWRYLSSAEAQRIIAGGAAAPPRHDG
jgi:protein-S-isoprenylcysteine O-methyltransferase Ste14